MLGLHVDHHVTDMAAGLQVLTGDVDPLFGEDLVDLVHHTRLVAVNVQQAAGALVARQRHFREVDGGEGGAVVGVFDQLVGHFQPDVLLRLMGGATNVRGQDHILQPTQRALELFVIGLGLDREDVDGGAGNMAALDDVSQRIDIHHGTAGGVDEDGARFHHPQLLGTDHVLGGGGFRHVQADDVRHIEQLDHARHLNGVAQRELVLDIVVINLHADALGDDAKLGADVAVADDAELLAAGFHRAVGQLFPHAAMALGVFLGDTAQQQQDLAQYQFGDRTGVGEGCVEDRNAADLGRFQLDLVGADAEAADGDQLVGGVEHLLGDLGSGAQPDEMDIADLLDQLLFGERGLEILHTGVTCGTKGLYGVGVNPLQQQNLDFILVQRKLGSHDDPSVCANVSAD